MTLRYLLDNLKRAHQAGMTQEVDHILGLVSEWMASTPMITATPDTIVACAKCHDTAAPEYRLRRVMGRYVLLCFKNGQGCWEHSPRPTCSFKDNEGVQCTCAAEALVTYGHDQINQDPVCALHVGAMLTPAHGPMVIYSIED